MSDPSSAGGSRSKSAGYRVNAAITETSEVRGFRSPPGIPRFRSLVDELTPLIVDIEAAGAMGDEELSKKRPRPC